MLRLPSELLNIIQRLLPINCALNLVMTNRDIHHDIIDAFQAREYIEKLQIITRYLEQSEYDLFTINLDKFYQKYNGSRQYREDLVKLLLKVLNQVTIPTIWITSQNGYYDIRYLFELVYYGGRIKLGEITSQPMRTLYNIYYPNILHYFNNSRDMMIRDIVENNTLGAFLMLSRGFRPFPKNNYNYRNFKSPLEILCR